MSGARVDRSGITLMAAMCGLVLFVIAAQLGWRLDDRQPVPAHRAKMKAARVTVPEPSALVTGSLGVIALGIVYACRHRRIVQENGPNAQK